MVVDVELEERYWYPDDGGIVWLAGYQPVGADGRFLGPRRAGAGRGGPADRRRGGRARHHADALASDDVAPGAPLELRRDAGNEHDPNAIAVHVPGGEQLGWVPREIAAELAGELDAGRPLAASCCASSGPPRATPARA